ncbi:hypothetical protein ILYODFUR_017008 [Ilyodon furcidens]|uniref:Uncharacterized protein n=2 Tax=Goodeidae TaxID=28758 RepID=A0ABV0TZI0_9TELE
MLILIFASLLLTATVFKPPKTSITCMANPSVNPFTMGQNTSNEGCSNNGSDGCTGNSKNNNVTTASEDSNKQKSDNLTFSSLLKKMVEDLPLLIVFGVGILIGSFVSTFIACLAIKCHRKKKSCSTEKLELVTTETAPKDCDDGIPDLQNNGILDMQDDGIQNQVAARSGEEPAGDLIDSNLSPKEIVYSDIDFSAVKKKDPTDAKGTEDITEPEYAEIKREEMDEAQENEGMDSEMLEGNDETEVMIEHQEEAKQGMLAEDVIGEHVSLYSNTNEDEN